MTTHDPSHTRTAYAALLAAASADHDFAGWLAAVLSTVAADLGSTSALTARRPGSWEAQLVQQLTIGTAGRSDEHLSDHKRALE